MDSRIFKLARSVRKACDAACQNGTFDKYSVNQKDLCGACAIASYALYKKLLSEGYEVKFILGIYKDGRGKHCWVKLGSTYVDVTATQFSFNGDKPKVYVSNDPAYIPSYYGKFAINIVRSWHDQNPGIYKYKWKNDKLIIKKKNA